MRASPVALAAVLILVALAPVTMRVALAHGPVHARIDKLTKELERSPDDAGVLAKRGALFMLDEDYARAARDFERAHTLQPGLENIENRLADALLKGGHAKRAEEVATAIVARDPRNADGYVVRARARTASADRAGAAADYTRAIALSKRPSPRHYHERAAVLDDPAEAVASLREGIARLGPIASLVEPAVDRELEVHRHDAALSLVAQLPEGLQRSPKWLAKRAAILARAGRTEQARSSYEEALAAIDALPPSRRDSDAHHKLREEIERALAALPTAAPSEAKSPTIPTTWWLLLAVLAVFALGITWVRSRGAKRPEGT